MAGRGGGGLMKALFEVSEAFTGLPVGLDEEGAERYLRRELAARGADHPVDAAMVRPFHTLSQTLRSAGTLFVGSSLRLVNGQPSTATLLVTVRGFDYGDDPRVAAEGALHSLVAAKGRGWTGGVYELPCGPAAVVTGGHAYEVPWNDPSRPPFTLRFAELQAHVPVPAHPSLPERHLLTVTFSTAHPSHWDAYMPSVARTLHTVTFVAEDSAPAEAANLSPEEGEPAWRS
ncbi:hypothetical protein FH609_019850 [Streptomyces sp. 3MP-14]|uniref:Uncharacterized protein n=1 Tax=Streptomyces mimosae TaxID=2586635 RepID=A0A5N5ZV59_9ACTN|nr:MULTISPECIES: hypothetical protein [Streptomyces]KAB8158908.1 hypothetical protein FH607_028850 [Streptomyces mimosae]KAB8174852.1 hypothetical protein FH609_019850 [Streptomyces sp. 3MP-14]